MRTKKPSKKRRSSEQAKREMTLIRLWWVWKRANDMTRAMLDVGELELAAELLNLEMRLDRLNAELTGTQAEFRGRMQRVREELLSYVRNTVSKRR